MPCPSVLLFIRRKLMPCRGELVTLPRSFRLAYAATCCGRSCATRQTRRGRGKAKARNRQDMEYTGSGWRATALTFDTSRFVHWHDPYMPALQRPYSLCCVCSSAAHVASSEKEPRFILINHVACQRAVATLRRPKMRCAPRRPQDFSETCRFSIAQHCCT